MEESHRGYGKLYAGFIHRFSKLSYYFFAGGKNFSELVLGKVNFKDDVKIIDIGCGVGNLLHDIHLKIKRKNKRHFMCGVDRSKEMLKIVVNKSRESKMGAVFVICDANNLPFRSDAFDVGFNVLFFHHLCLEGKTQVLSEMKRVLKADAEFIIMDLDKPTSIIGWIIALSRWHVPAIRENFQYGLEYLFSKSGLIIKDYSKKMGLFSYYKVIKAQ